MAATSSVPLNDSTRPCGSRLMNPTVSETSTGSPPGSANRLVVGIERREEPVLGEHAGLGQAVEQRRLARIGVADDGHGGEAAA